MSEDTSPNDERNWLLYDGECPFCSRYITLLRLRDIAPGLQLLDARENTELVEEVAQQGYEVDDGMLLRMNGRYYYGADCIHVLSMIGDAGTAMQKTNRFVFSSDSRSRTLYPMLKAGRAATLRVMGLRRIRG